MRDRKPSWPRLHRRGGGPVAWWLLDAPRGTYPGDAGQVADLTGNNAAAALPAGWAFGVGPLGACLRNVSATAPVQVADAPRNRLAYLTVTARGKLDAVGTGRHNTIACKYQNADSSSTGLAWIFRLENTGRIAVYLNAGSFAAYDTGYSPTAGGWHHYAFSYDGATLHFYVDGSPVYSSAAGPGPLLTSIQSPVGVGDSNGGAASSEYWTGSLDDIRLYDRALSAGEIAREYADPYWRLRPRGYDPAVLDAMIGAVTVFTVSAAGGCVAGGTGAPSPSWSPPGAGGAAAGGSSPGSPSWSPPGAGGAALGGTLTTGGPAFGAAGAGGPRAGGAAPFSPSWSTAGAGGASLGGAGAAGTGTAFTVTGAGGCVAGGAAGASALFTPAAAGGLAFGGVIAPGVTWSPLTAAGLRLGGVAVIGPTAARTADPSRATAARLGPDPRRATTKRL